MPSDKIESGFEEAMTRVGDDLSNLYGVPRCILKSFYEIAFIDGEQAERPNSDARWERAIESQVPQ